MAITGMTLIQSGGVYPQAVHSPIAYIVDVDYTSTAPDTIWAGTNIFGAPILSCIPYSDPQSGKRQFILFVDEFIRGYMESFDDTVQTDSTNEFRPNKSLDVIWCFKDPATSTTYITYTAHYVHAARQFGEDFCMMDIYNNVTESYIGVVGHPCYVYCYNDDTTNTITVAEA